MRVVRTAYGARVVERGAYLSKVLARPGATDDVFDVLAAAVAAFAPPGDVALLGFAGGGMVAPLRALGVDERIAAVDLDLTGHAAFRDLCGAWSGDVAVDRADAGVWLERAAGRTTRFSAIVDDLSVPGARATDEVTKPSVSLDAIPRLARRALARSGVAIVNALPVPGVTWASAIARYRGRATRAIEIRLRDHYNRVVVAGARLPAAVEAGRRLRAKLVELGSSQATRLEVRTVSAEPVRDRGRR